MMRDDVIGQKPLVPWIEVDSRQVADLATDPVAMGKIAAELSNSLLEHVIANVDSQERNVPKIGALFEIHRLPALNGRSSSLQR